MEIRNCGFKGGKSGDGRRPVWARHGVTSERCPKSVITAESLRFIEEFQIWKRFGCADAGAMNARTAEALAIVEDEWRKEVERMRRSEGG